MKIAKLSLVAAVAITGFTTVTSANTSANTLAEAFAASKIKGELKSQYFQKKANTGVESSIWTNGGNLSLTTGSFNGLVAGVTFQTAHVATDDNVAAYSGDMDVSGSVMSEAYLAYTMNNTTIKAGRQYISTPLVAGSGSRMLKQSFEGIVLVNTDVPNTTLVAAYVDKFQARTDGTGGTPDFEQVADGAYTVYAKNTSIANLTVQAQYAQIQDYATTGDAKIAYLDANYKLNPVTISAQTWQSDDGSATNSDGALYAAKIAANISGLDLSAAYSISDDDANVIYGLGAGTFDSYVTPPITGDEFTADTKAYKIAAGYQLPMNIGLNLSYANWKAGSMADSSESNITVSYAYNKALSTKIMYSDLDNMSNDYQSRVYVSYKF